MSMEHTAIEHARRLARWCGHLWSHRDYDDATRGLTSPLDIARAVDQASPDVLRPAELALPDGILCPAVDGRGCYVHESARKRIRWEIEPDAPLSQNPRTVVWIQSGTTSWTAPGTPGAVATLVVRRVGPPPIYDYLSVSLYVIAEPRADYAQLAIEAAEALGVADNPAIAEKIVELRAAVERWRAEDPIKRATMRAAQAAFTVLTASAAEADVFPDAVDYSHYFDEPIDPAPRRVMLEALQD